MHPLYGPGTRQARCRRAYFVLTHKDNNVHIFSDDQDLIQVTKCTINFNLLRGPFQVHTAKSISLVEVNQAL